MKITTKINLDRSTLERTLWSGALDTLKYLTDEEIEQVGYILEDTYPDGMDEGDLNDFFWFEDDTIADWLGYNDFDELMERSDNE